MTLAVPVNFVVDIGGVRVDKSATLPFYPAPGLIFVFSRAPLTVRPKEFRASRLCYYASDEFTAEMFIDLSLCDHYERAVLAEVEEWRSCGFEVET